MTSADALRRPSVTDVLIAVVCTTISIGLLLALPLLSDAGAVDPVAPGQFRWWSILLGLVIQGVLLLWAAQVPRLALLVVAAVAFGVTLATPGEVSGLSSPAVVVLVFRAALASNPMRLVAPLSGVAVLVVLGEAIGSIGDEAMSPGPAIAGGLLQAVAVVGLPLVLGMLVGSRRDVSTARRDEQRARTEQRDAQIQAAVARERTAMARELHDIAAHHLSGIALMAAVVDRQIDSAPEEARRGVQQVRAQSTAVLDDLRRLVGLLRDDGAGERSVETLATVPELVEGARMRGPVELVVRTADDRVLGTGIGPLAQLVLYRTVQEALTNASTHAPGAARSVVVDDRAAAFAAVTVTNAPSMAQGGRSSAGGFGLVGMRERADLVGADLSYGATPDGGWEVHASVPREEQP